MRKIFHTHNQNLPNKPSKTPTCLIFFTVGKEALERDIENALVEHITRFLLELGAGFAYVGRQVNLEVGGEDFFLDLLFYHLKLRCYVLDNHSAHISKETMKYLATRPGRFEYVHTPKHGSWLNLVVCAFSKMARSFLRHIRVTSKEELKERILKGIAEINEAPVPFRWKKFDLELA